MTLYKEIYNWSHRMYKNVYEFCYKGGSKVWQRQQKRGRSGDKGTLAVFYQAVCSDRSDQRNRGGDRKDYHTCGNRSVIILPMVFAMILALLLTPDALAGGLRDLKISAAGRRLISPLSDDGNSPHPGRKAGGCGRAEPAQADRGRACADSPGIRKSGNHLPWPSRGASAGHGQRGLRCNRQHLP